MHPLCENEFVGKNMAGKCRQVACAGGQGDDYIFSIFKTKLNCNFVAALSF